MVQFSFCCFETSEAPNNKDDGLSHRRKENFGAGASSHQVARTYIHEVGHNLGLHHKDMPSSGSIDVSWLPDEFIPLKKAKTLKPKPNIIEVRARHAQKKLDEWNKKSARAKNLVKKYKRKVKYYEKKMAASPK